MQTIIKITYTNYTERAVVTESNFSELARISKEQDFVKYEIVQQGEFIIPETDRAIEYLALDFQITSLEEAIAAWEVESMRCAKYDLSELNKAKNKIYLRKGDKVAINDFYTCEMV